ncbi:hypothetical protein [Mycobacterium sp. NPDC050041]|uniref:hypothetical protein n=1 Tax=Mycobacterium sp. NPDC050041 TaxID=3364293 RepID=UPI003C2FA4BC
MSVTGRRAHRWVSPVIGAAAIALLAVIPTAGAEPREWDIGDFDSCERNQPPSNSVEEYIEHVQWCCYRSGGDWNAATSTCVAPLAANSPIRRPGGIVIPDQVLVENGAPRNPGPPVPTGETVD